MDQGGEVSELAALWTVSESVPVSTRVPGPILRLNTLKAFSRVFPRTSGLPMSTSRSPGLIAQSCSGPTQVGAQMIIVPRVPRSHPRGKSSSAPPLLSTSRRSLTPGLTVVKLRSHGWKRGGYSRAFHRAIFVGAAPVSRP
jgi:hypothetical protein